MTEKVKITKEQAAAIERYKKELIDSVDEQYRFGVKRTPYEWAEPLVELGGEQVLNTLRNGYEVEPEFEVGDWVATIHNEAPIIFKVKSIQQTVVDSDHLMGSGYERIFNISEIRHATPEEIAKEKQRRWWNEHYRKVWELKKGDVLLNLEYNVAVLIHSDRTLETSARNRFKVICFAENREDYEVDDK